MLSLFKRSKQARPETSTKPKRTNLNVEELEGRLVPAKIDILSPAYAVGTASLSSSSGSPYTRTNSVSLAGNTWNGAIKRVYASNLSLAEAYARLNYWNVSPQSKKIELTSYANATGNYRDAWARTYTSPHFNSQQLGWIPVKISPSTAGEYIGKPVTVTLTANVQVNKGYTGYSFNDIRVWQNGTSTVLLRGDNMGYQSRSVTINATVGETFYVHMHSYAKAPSATSVTAVSRLDITI